MFRRLRDALVPRESAPPPTPAEIAQQKLEREHVQRRAAAAVERAAAVEARVARERQEAEAHAERVQRSREDIERACRGPLRMWWPGDVHPVPRDRYGLPRRGLVGRVLDVLRGGG